MRNPTKWLHSQVPRPGGIKNSALSFNYFAKYCEFRNSGWRKICSIGRILTLKATGVRSGEDDTSQDLLSTRPISNSPNVQLAQRPPRPAYTTNSPNKQQQLAKRVGPTRPKSDNFEKPIVNVWWKIVQNIKSDLCFENISWQNVVEWVEISPLGESVVGRVDWIPLQCTPDLSPVQTIL